MCCSALQCCRFDVSQESLFQASKRSNMSSAVLQGDPSADFPNYYFTKRSDMDCVEVQGRLFADIQNDIFRFETFRNEK